MKKILCLFLAVIVGFSGCSHLPGKRNSSNISSVFSDEIAIGQEIHAQILSSNHVYTEPNLVAYVNGIGRSLAAHSARKKLPYQITLLYEPKIYATSAPGGFIYVTTGLLNFLDNEAELAAVIGHEIGELQFRDPKLSKTTKVLQAVTQGAAIAGPLLGQIGALAVLGLVLVNVAVDAVQIKGTKRLHKADALAMKYMVAEDYDPQGLIDVIHKFLNADKRIATYFYDYYQNRPITEERVVRINKAFSKLPLEGKSFDVYRTRYQEMTKGAREMYPVQAVA